MVRAVAGPANPRRLRDREFSVTKHALDAVPLADKYYFAVRRLHSLSGLVPLGVFLCVHLTTNATVLAPSDVAGEEFQKSVERIHALGPLLVPVEIVGIFIPLAFHALLGLQIWLTSTPNMQQYRYGGNIRYTLQRITAVIALAFILYHVWQMHWMGAPFGGGKFQLHDEAGAPTAALSTARAIQSAWWVAPIYAVGIIAIVFHLANGIWSSLITWGITIRPKTQRVSGYVCAAFGVLLCLVGLGALRGFRTINVAGMRQVAPAHATSTTHVKPLATTTTENR